MGILYEGEGGVFYDALNDKIFILENKTRMKFYNIVTKTSREIYTFDITYQKDKYRGVQVILHKEVTWIGYL